MPQPAMKYVIIGDSHGYEFPILFPTVWSHQEVAQALAKPNTAVVAAGFVVRSADGTLACSLGSQSLGIRSRPDRDAAVITAWLSSQ